MTSSTPSPAASSRELASLRADGLVAYRAWQYSRTLQMISFMISRVPPPIGYAHPQRPSGRRSWRSSPSRSRTASRLRSTPSAPRTSRLTRRSWRSSPNRSCRPHHRRSTLRALRTSRRMRRSWHSSPNRSCRPQRRRSSPCSSGASEHFIVDGGPPRRSPAACWLQRVCDPFKPSASSKRRASAARAWKSDPLIAVCLHPHAEGLVARRARSEPPPRRDRPDKRDER
jgi:hypothetical protein